MSSIQQRYEAQRRRLEAVGQQHLLAFWPRLNEMQRAELLADLELIDFDRCQGLIETHVRTRPAVTVPGRIEPPTCYPAEPAAALVELYERARRTGVDAIRSGKVAALTVAGGQGTRLGYDGPKGAFAISPVRNAPLFQLFAESLLGVERRWGHRPRWYIMTSRANHDPTIRFFDQHAFFGLSPAEVVFFQQSEMPAFLPDGRIALAAPHRVALSPDGHGGSLWALARSGAMDDMRRRGIDTISYFQVDNPLVRTIDPLFIGLHRLTGSEMSSKAVHKAHDTERVGVFCLVDGRSAVIEYSDLPVELARARNPDGTRRFDAGSIAVHVIDRGFIERLTAPDASVSLPWHRAEKRVATVDTTGRVVTPAEPNTIKLEMFIFDAIPLARNPLVLYTLREEEFSPVKNAEGDDSPATARRDLIRRAACWLESCGHPVPRGSDGEPRVAIELGPAVALDCEDLRTRADTLPPVAPDGPYLLA